MMRNFLAELACSVIVLIQQVFVCPVKVGIVGNFAPLGVHVPVQLLRPIVGSAGRIAVRGYTLFEGGCVGITGDERREAWRCVVETRTSLGEGAFWDRGEGVLYWVDILRGEIHRYAPHFRGPAGEDRYVTLGAHCGTVVPREGGGLAAALPNGIVAVDPDWMAAPRTARHAAAAVEQELLCELEPDNAETRANDGKCDPHGRLWQGTMGYDPSSSRGALYRIGCDAAVEQVLTGVRISNGLCWDEEARLMYHIDTPTRRVDAFDFDPETGSVGNRRAVIRVDADLGFPDGMTIDEEGNLWIAMWDGGCVTCWDPRTGGLLASYELPASRVTSCAFGGPELGELYVTTASTGLSASELARQPLAGSLFVLEPGVQGRAMARFCG